MKYDYIDTHAHVNLRQFDVDRDEVLKRTREAKVAHINVGTRKETSKKAVEIAKENDGVYAIVGLHPLEVIGNDPDDDMSLAPERVFDVEFYRSVLAERKVVGIGECGFDYFHHGDETYELQREMFEAQIELANEVGKPLMLHLRNGKIVGMRNAYDDAIEILKQKSKVRGNAHFYAGTREQAKQFFDMGYTISCTGVITFTHDYDEVIKEVPLTMLHAETDCPYVAPVPHRGARCEPLMVREVYKRIALIRNENEESIREQLLENARTLYTIK